jgi:hypothetical protein
MFYGPLGTAVFSFTLATHVLHPILYAVPSNIYNAYGSCVLPCDTSCYSSTWCAHDECLTAASYRWQEPSLFPVLIKELSPKIPRKLLIFVNLLRLCSVSGVYSIMSILRRCLITVDLDSSWILKTLTAPIGFPCVGHYSIVSITFVYH